MTDHPPMTPAQTSLYATAAQAFGTLARYHHANGNPRAASLCAAEAAALLDRVSAQVDRWTADADNAAMLQAAQALADRIHADPVPPAQAPAPMILAPGLEETLVNLADEYGPNGLLVTLHDLYPGLASPAPSTPGADMVRAERLRQIEEEGYTIDHDLARAPAGTLARAAGAYLLAVNAYHEDVPVPGVWPFPPEEWKPSVDPVRNLVKAAALIVAELDATLVAAQREAEALGRTAEPGPETTLGEHLAAEGAPTVEDLLARRSPNPGAVFACLSPAAAGAEHRCGQFTVPPTCTAGACTATDAVEAPPAIHLTEEPPF